MVAGTTIPRMRMASSATAIPQADAHLPEWHAVERPEQREHLDHHEHGAGDDAGRAVDAVRDGILGAHAAVVGLAHVAEDEYVVVHREVEPARRTETAAVRRR
jgi:hypothetical protein